MPIAISVGSSADPPYDKSGSGIPTMGSSPITAPRLTSVCAMSQMVIPAAA